MALPGSAPPATDSAEQPSPGPLERAFYQGLTLWISSRLGILLLAVVGAGVLFGEETKPLLERWRAWDANLLIVIAEHGYDGEPGKPDDPGLPAFFPGMPLMLRLVHLVVSDWTLAGILISLVAGGVATVALVRLGDFEGPVGTGRHAVLLLLLCPTAVFLFAGYSEALFLAFAIPAWLAARRGDWLSAGLLGAGASCVRITGLFLAIALIVEYFTGPWRAERAARPPYRRNISWLLAPFVPLALYSAYQYGRTGDWLAWNHAQEAGWGRSLVMPWESWATTWASATGDGQFSWAFRMEIAGAIVGVLFTLWLLVRRRWSELTYVGLQVGALVCSAYYLSIPRSALLWWPLWLALARLGTARENDESWMQPLRPGVIAVYGFVLGPLMVVNTLTYLKGGWAG
ncbi:mannosyltransferase family protein [Spongiactinospora sp. TRM90649]|uniref:mannosyltransferase family protein n=1 Tax=Spongiactinospora sp. TRM90649 TaxID=3031114 RepID=UPI0023F8CB0D|nr:mannosyltransferase family protein [Spongiactinospora sp. TRM90649]MDF5756139.1 mannosyltransferase family protein [Spongiactinospora sp. TRM90649]